MARARGGGLALPSDDDLIEIHAGAATRPRNNIENLLNPQRPSSPQRPRAIRPNGRLSRWDRPPLPRQPATTFIDLTEEPDSPVGQRAPQQPSLGGRNPRRTNSQRISPPRLARSDSTFIVPGASVIDLTVEPAEDGRQAEPPRQLRPRHHHHYHHHHHHRPGGLASDQLIELEFINGGVGLYTNFARGVRQMAGLFGSELIRNGFNGPALEFAASISPREPSPKPPMEEVPPTRDGFTRGTCANSKDTAERVVICPACNEELAYDPSETTVQSASLGGNKKRKRAPGEHHFWAVKKCGHVYCADCFENRRPTKAAPNGVGFRGSGGKLPGSGPNDLRCAVENCETKVAAKTEWIGIYL
ncbi:hypothetical protein TOPH_04573 [Tolypocladium ophioglossoides CBS 100239]|uniref:Cell cycle control protein n=1 Tax=Tolypocladium ophioglossoides (strain CBS 100239) TaxID=1163406 RepID=A0A0L0N9M0_TOLOC|nr:hypothetical protein TOPH_04573 [Tolypocladium ophioglossoides CBS 100239]